MPDFNATVLIATYNRAGYIAEAVDSILAQTLPPAQIIVVDDGCTDGTAEILAGYGDHIDVLRQANSGKSSAINAALSHVRGDYLWIFDDDDLALPKALEIFAGAFRNHPDAGFIYCSFDDVRAKKDNSFRTVARNVIPEILPEQVFVELLFGNVFRSGAAIMAKTICYNEIGPFDEDLVRSQDYEMYLRMSRRYTGVGITDVTFLRRLHDGQFGDAQESVGFTDKQAIWLKYDRVIAQRLFDDLEYVDYVPERQEATQLSAQEERLFRIRRCAMMAVNGLWEPALDDLDAFAALYHSDGRPILTAEEKTRLRLLMNPRYTHIEKSLGKQVASLRRILADPRNASIRELLKRELWRGAFRDARRRHPRRCWRTLWFSLSRI